MKVRLLIVGSMLLMASAYANEPPTVAVYEPDIGEKMEMGLSAISEAYPSIPIQVQRYDVAVLVTGQLVNEQDIGYDLPGNTKLPEKPGFDVFLNRIKAADRHNIRLCS